MVREADSEEEEEEEGSVAVRREKREEKRLAIMMMTKKRRRLYEKVCLAAVTAPSQKYIALYDSMYSLSACCRL